MKERYGSKVFAVSALILCAICIGIGMRIQMVNAQAITVPTEVYQQEEKLELDGAFVEVVKENTQGYALKVNAAQLVSYNEYLREHGMEKVAGSGHDNKCIVEVDITFFNEGNTDGFLDVMGYKLIPERKDEYFIIDSALWRSVEKNAPGETMGMTLLPNTTYRTSIPFVKNTSDDLVYSDSVDDTKWILNITNAPVQKMVDITCERNP
ncbi:MAG: DUF5028 domain-containing protein [Eggerthella sp.]|nr:DUF5028 domain-containing protein [Eggerthella sp.]